MSKRPMNMWEFLDGIEGSSVAMVILALMVLAMVALPYVFK